VNRLPTPRAQAPKAEDLSAQVGSMLEEIGWLEEELAFLDREIPPLQARLEAAVRPLWERIVEVRREMVRIAQRASDSAPRKGAFGRDAQELVAHLVSDLEERFGVRVRTEADRWDGGAEEPDEDILSEDDGEPFRARPEPARASARQAPGKRRARMDPERAARDIYRTLAKELHPDKTRDELEQVRRTSLMQDLTSAWTSRDLGALLRLLHAHGSREARSDALDGTSLEACIEGLREELEKLRIRVRERRHRELPSEAKDWMLLARDPKLFERVVRREKAGPRAELEQMESLARQWLGPGGLERFFREAPDDRWRDLV
jgi:hypothetical protein